MPHGQKSQTVKESWVAEPQEAHSGTWKVGIVGCGNIFERYVSGLARFPRLEVVGCADLDPARSQAASEAQGCLSSPIPVRC